MQGGEGVRATCTYQEAKVESPDGGKKGKKGKKGTTSNLSAAPEAVEEGMWSVSTLGGENKAGAGDGDMRGAHFNYPGRYVRCS